MNKKIIGFFKSYKIIIIRLLFTFLFIILFQIGSLVTIPGVKWLNTSKNPDQFIKLLSIIGGGILSKLSIFAIGISPFITASIIVQLLSSGLIPKLSQWIKQGKKGQVKINYLTKFFMIPIGYAQSLGILTSLKQSGIIEIGWSMNSAANEKLFYWFLCPLVLLAGTMITLFIAELITQKGIGSGTSIIIFTGILFSFSHQMQKGIGGISTFNDSIKFSIYLFSILLLLFFIILLNNSQRKIPIQQTGSGLRLKNEQKSFLPIKLNPSGVIPVIFASTLVSFFGSIKGILKTGNNISYASKNYIKFVDKYLNFSEWWGIAFFALLVFLFGLLYAHIAINSEKMSIDFKKNGVYIIGIKTGEQTENYISYILKRISFFGSLYLMFLAIFSLIMKKTLFAKNDNFILSGTSLLILVVIGENIIGQIRDLLIQTKYLNFHKQRKDPFLW